MAWYPHATQRELPYAHTMPTRRPAKALCVHTNGGGTDNGSLYGWFSRPGNTVASHFQVMRSGRVEQYVDASRQAYAQVAGNDHCVSAECEDDGNPSTPLTDAQIAALVGIATWLGVPAKVASETGDGVSWHSLFASYNPHHHDCPGSVRVAQIRTELIPNLAAKPEDDVTDADIEKIAQRVAALVWQADTMPAPAESPSFATNKTWTHDSGLSGALNLLYRIAKKVGA